MKYKHIVQGNFISRPNRFIAHVLVDGKEEVVHVKNTGRCKELLKENAVVYLEHSDNRNRKTQYDLVTVKKGSRLVNMDSQAPNKIVEEWLYKKILFPDLVSIRPETKYGNSRFDFYVETKTDKIFIEVKGVTLENNNIVSFPDAPSLRALKHVEELVEATKQGYKAYVIFVVQMKSVTYFTPNIDTQKEFADALIKAKAAGVEILAYDCLVEPEEIILQEKVEVRLQGEAGSILEPPLELMVSPLLLWYHNNKRKLPWRDNITPYGVWVSEIMLQQTRVEAVKPFYKRFMEALPDIESLARAQEEKLLKLWEGLGYYSRVRNLKVAAMEIMEKHRGEMPRDYESILALKGIGSYTAGAIASIAFGIKRPAVDGNVLRVLARYRCDSSLITDAKVKKKIEQELLPVMPGDCPGDFNQALMELGACVCIPNGQPLCHLCPLSSLCKAHLKKEELNYPQKAAKKPRVIEEKTILILRSEDKLALQKRPEKGLLANMYELPSIEGFCGRDEINAFLQENGLKALRFTKLEESKHIFSHKEWHMRGYMVRVDELEPIKKSSASADWIFVEPMETKENYPIPAAFAAYTKYLEIKLGQNKFR
ncbi:A/G-specific adenine glycosylase [Lachnospiraceae bacterium OttesenSCG-928-D06]|nr:A/G-specific adenine glycosylase [Lachnospiraceae bacterium OttesenSCG-928-D06]